MTLFEYLAIAFSLVFSFSGMRLVGGLPHAVRGPRRYWLHLSFVCLQLLATVMVFWLFWSFRTIEWTFPMFLLVLVSPGLIYYNACILIPENPSLVESWHDYYYSVRVRYFVGLSLWVTAVATISTIVLKMPLLHPARAIQASLLAAALLGAFSANRRLHAILLLFFLVLSVLIALTFAFRPGALTLP
jgi:hypothetical protein